MKDELKNFIKNLIKRYTKSKPISNTKILENIKVNFPKVKMSTADVRIIINSLRQEEVPIIADSRGYFYSEDREEVVAHAQSLQNRIDAIEAAKQGLLNYVKGIV